MEDHPPSLSDPSPSEQWRAEGAQISFAAVAESSPDAIITKTTTGIITSWNPGAEKIFGYRAEEMIGRSVLQLFPPSRQLEEQALLARIARGERIERFESERLRRDAAERQRLVDGQRRFVLAQPHPGHAPGERHVLVDNLRQRVLVGVLVADVQGGELCAGLDEDAEGG